MCVFFRGDERTGRMITIHKIFLPQYVSLILAWLSFDCRDGTSVPISTATHSNIRPYIFNVSGGDGEIWGSIKTDIRAI